MKNKLILLLVLLGAFSISFGQSGPLRWKFANTGDAANIRLMETDPFGNTYLAGTFGEAEFGYEGIAPVSGVSGGETLNTFILKLDQTGKPIWLRSVHGAAGNASVKPTKMSISARGELALVITASSTPIVEMGETTLNIPDTVGDVPVIVKYSQKGALSWAYSATVDGSVNEIKINDLFIDEQGDVFATGYFRGLKAHLGGAELTGFTNDGTLIVTCIKTNGEIAWFNSVPTDNGDNGDLIGVNIANTSGTFFYVAGVHQGYRRFVFGTDTLGNSFETDVFISRFGKDGNAHWGRKFSGDSIEVPADIKVLNNNNLVILGASNSFSLFIGGSTYNNSFTNYNLFLANFTESGNPVSSRSINTGLAYFYEESAFLFTDSYDNVYIAAEFENDEVFPTEGTVVNVDAGSSDVFAAKLNNTSMNPYWTVQAAAPGYNYLEAACLSAKGELFLGGTSYKADFTIGGEPIPTDESTGVPYLTKIKENGVIDYLYTQTNTNENSVSFREISCDSYGNAFIAGSYFGPQSSVEDISLTDLRENGIFLAKYAQTNVIRGVAITDEEMPVTSGYAKIYGCTFYQRAPLNDSVRLADNGTFEFADIPLGEYIITVIPTGEAKEEYLPTYFPESEYWEFAEDIIVDNLNKEHFYPVIVQKRSQFTGISRLGGTVEEEEYTNVSPVKFSKARPSKKSRVVMAGSKAQKSTYQVVSVTETDDEGNFSFNNIEDGDYFVWADIPGLPCEPVYFIEVSGGSWISNLDYLVTEDIIEGTGYPIYDMLEAGSADDELQIFPNPASDQITINSAEFRQANIDFYDVQGKHLKHMELSTGQSEQVNVSDLKAGQYIIRFMSDEQIIFRKLTIQ